MKKINYLLPAVAVMALASSCSSDDDKIVLESAGTINLTGKYVTYMHGLQGWIAEDEIGVFVSCKDDEQANVKYTPSEVCPLVENKWVPGIFTYDDDNKADGDIVLNSNNPVQFYTGQGSHSVYAYVPYQEGKVKYQEVLLPSQTVQDWPDENTFCPKKKYCFAYAKTSMSSYSSAPGKLEFETPLIQMTVSSPELPDDFVGKKLTKFTVSAPVDIAVDNATIDLSTGKISGSLSKSIEITLPAGGLEIEKGFFGANFETMYISMCIPFDTAMETEFTFTYTIDNKEYIAKNTPNVSMSSSDNINMYDRLSLK